MTNEEKGDRCHYHCDPNSIHLFFTAHIASQLPVHNMLYIPAMFSILQQTSESMCQYRGKMPDT